MKEYITHVPERPADAVSFANYLIERRGVGEDTVFIVIATWFAENGRVSVVIRTTGMPDSREIASRLHGGVITETFAMIRSPMAIIAYVNNED